MWFINSFISFLLQNIQLKGQYFHKILFKNDIQKMLQKEFAFNNLVNNVVYLILDWLWSKYLQYDF